MTRHLVTGLLLFCFILAGGCARLPQHPDQLAYPTLEFHPPEVEKLVLDNGIRLYLKEDKELPLVQVTAMIGSGAITTPPELTGFDSLFGATWRTGGAGARSPQELDETLDFLAADLGASMGPYSCQLNLSLRSADLETGLDILSALLRLPHFDKEKLEIARLKAKEAVRRQNDNPSAIAHRLLRKALYPDHYIGRSATQESLDAIGREEMVRFHESYFAPNNLWLAISGDFDRAELLSLLDGNLGDWSSREVPEQPLPPIRPNTSGEIQVVVKELPQTTILVGDLGLTKDHPGQYAVQVMNYILGGGGFNSRLMREVRSNEGLAYSAYSYFQVGRRLPGQFVAGTETSNVPRALSLIRGIMGEMRDLPVSVEEVTLARESMINSFVFGFENAHAVVSQQMSLDFFNYPENYLRDYRARIAAVTIEDVQRVAREFIDFERQQIVLVGDAEAFLEELGPFALPVREVDLDAVDRD